MAYFILGRSGSGKTEKLYQFMKEKPEQQEAVLIVPEQCSFQNEKKLLTEFSARTAKKIRVLSFKRLCNMIFGLYQGITEKRIDDGAKAVLMSMAIDNAPAQNGELELFNAAGKGRRRRTDMIEPMLTAVNEYKMCLITPDRLMALSRTVKSPVLASKLRDSASIYAAYDALLENTYADPDDDLKKLYDILQKHPYFKNKYVYVDSFTGFSAQEMKILELVFVQAEEVYLTLCMDPAVHHNDSTIFAEADSTLKTLLRICQRECITAHLVTDLPQGKRFQKECLKTVEETIFSGFRCDTADTEAVPDDGSVVLYEAEDVYDEIAFTAEKICTLVRTGKYQYSNIEIIAGDLSAYKNVIAAEFPKYHIPFFLSDPQPLETRPLIRLMTAAFEAVLTHYDTEAMLHLAKTGLTSLSDNEVFELENYAYIWSIKNKRWCQPFTMETESYQNERARKASLIKKIEQLERLSSGENTQDVQQLEKLKKQLDSVETVLKTRQERIDQIEASRRKLTEPLVHFAEKLEQAENGGQITEALYELMGEYDTRTSYTAYIRRLIHHTDKRTVEIEKNIWEQAMNILNKMYDMLWDKKADAKYYFELMKLYIAKSPFSDIPATVNSVTVGKAGNVKADAPKVVFVIGAVQSVFPAQPSAIGIFTDSERRLLREGTDSSEPLPLYDAVYGNTLKEKFNAYAALTAASQQLYVSWYTQGPSGAPAEPSVIRDELKAVIQDIPVHHRQLLGADTPDNSQLFFTERQGFDICARLWNVRCSRSETLKAYYLASPAYQSRAEALDRAARNEKFRLKNRDNVAWLFKSPIYLSSTKLDSYAGCHFAYFCRYGLESSMLRKSGLDSRLYGSAVHSIFEKLLSEHSSDFQTMSDDELKKLIAGYLDEYIELLGYPEEKPPRFRSACSRIRKNAFMVLSRMREQFQGDQFRPVKFELHIGADTGEDGIPPYQLKLPTGERLVVTGYVDRVDLAEIEDKKYIRIIDYKTGRKDFSINNVLNGFNIQMLLYLSAIEKEGREYLSDGEELTPAAVLYVPSTASAKPQSSQTEKNTQSAINEQNSSLRLKGLLTSEKKVLEQMEKELKGKFIPVKETTIKKTEQMPQGGKKLTPFSGSVLATQQEINEILSYVDICLKQMGMELIAGSIEASPAPGSCDYCEYSSACRHEKGSPCRTQFEMDPQQALTYIRKKTEGENHNDGNQ